MKWKKPFFSALAVTIFLSAGLLVAELALRFFGAELGAPSFEVFDIPLDGRVHRASSIPGQGWELCPNIHERFQSVDVVTNSLGLRDRDYGPKNGALRVLALGDSITFGASVDQNSTFAKRLEALMNGPGERKVEVINAGVSGYNFVQSAIFYKARAKQYDPDLILVGFFGDDILPAYVPLDKISWLVRHSSLARILEDRIGGLCHGAASQPNQRILLAERAALARLQSFASEATREGRALLFVLQPELNPGGYEDHHTYKVWRNALDDLEIPYIEMARVYQRSGRPLTDFSINPSGDPHPNEMGHRLIAQAIFDFLEAHPALLVRKKDRAR